MNSEPTTDVLSLSIFFGLFKNWNTFTKVLVCLPKEICKENIKSPLILRRKTSGGTDGILTRSWYSHVPGLCFTLWDASPPDRGYWWTSLIALKEASPSHPQCHRLLPDQRPSSLWWHKLMSFTQQKPEALGATRWGGGGHPGHAETPLAIGPLSPGASAVGSLSATAAGGGDAELGTAGSRHQLSFLPGPHPSCNYIFFCVLTIFL